MSRPPTVRPAVPPLEWFRRNSGVFPELNFVTSIAVGFPVSIYRMGLGGPGAKAIEYQVMRYDESPGPGKAFWDDHLDSDAPQFFPTPEAACAAFVRAWLNWNRRHTTETPRWP